MTSKLGLAGGIPERRVRPVWDAIDSRQFKNALKLATGLLSKYPNSPYALALKALILERMGKTDEALSVCLNAKEILLKNDALLMDDLTLSTMQIVFQRLDHLDLATSCYEQSCAKFPNNLELMMGLFNCYVREYSFVKQQQTAIKMYKLTGEERFLLWAVCSIQLQVLCDNGGEKLLLLAEGLLKKHVTTHSLHEPEALMVYISILEQQSKFNDALEVLSGNLGSLMTIEVEKLRIRGRLLARAGGYVAAADVYENILELSPDDWEGYVHYLSCLLEDDSIWSHDEADYRVYPLQYVDCKFSQLSDDMFDSRMTNASDFVHKLQADSNNNYLRGPFLATVEIERRKYLNGNKNENELMEALMQYFLKFGHLACFASDVEASLQVCSPNKRIEFVKKLLNALDSLAAPPNKLLGQSTSIFKIQEETGRICKLPMNELLGFAVKMAKLFCENLSLSKDLDPQESMHGEELLAMTSSVLVQLYWRTRNFSFLVEAIMVLEFGLTIRRYVWQYKILLTHLYSHVGALPLAYERYKGLDVKNILLETVSHHILPQMLVSPLWTDLDHLLKDYLKFMDDHFRESADLTFLAYRHRNYSKAIEFVQFKKRLQQSNQYLAAKVEASILQLKQNADKIEEEERVLENFRCGVHLAELSTKIGSKSLTFNEDLQSRPWWTPMPEKNYLLGPFEEVSYYPKENMIKEREENVQKAVQRRSLLPRMIYLSIQGASATFKEISEVNGSVDPKISSELKFLLEGYAKTLGFSLNDAMEIVSDVSRGAKALEAFGSDVIDWLNFAVFSILWSSNSHERGQPMDDCKHARWHVVNTLFRKLISEKIRSMDIIVASLQTDFPILVQLVTEPLAWHVIVIQAFVRSLLPSGKKKKKSGTAEQSSSILTQPLRDSIQSVCDVVQEVAKWLANQIERTEESNVETLLASLQTNGEEIGPGHVYQVLESLAAWVDDSEVGERIFQALKTWDAMETARKISAGQGNVLCEFRRICESKIKLLESLKQQMSHI